MEVTQEYLKNTKESTYLVCNKYPNTLTSTYELLVHNSVHMSNDRRCHYQDNSHIGGRGSGRTSVIVAQDINHGRDDKYSVLVPGEDGNTSNIMCYKLGHMYHNCTEPDLCAIDSNGVAGGNGRLQGLHFVKTCLLFTQDGKRKLLKTIGCFCIQIVRR